ncbi:MAG TPA: hypothetical protein VG387_07025 [Rhizomicrobium sp.]|jgi:hypothetical protein|nr:hypothetical protein [Rhizomicrobium sp.]
MAKRKSGPTKRLPEPASKPLAAKEDAQPYRDAPNARFAPYDNLYDAIRGDMREFGIKGFGLKPLKRYRRPVPPDDDE